MRGENRQFTFGCKRCNLSKHSRYQLGRVETLPIACLVKSAQRWNFWRFHRAERAPASMDAAFQPHSNPFGVSKHTQQCCWNFEACHQSSIKNLFHHQQYVNGFARALAVQVLGGNSVCHLMRDVFPHEIDRGGQLLSIKTLSYYYCCTVVYMGCKHPKSKSKKSLHNESRARMKVFALLPKYWRLVRGQSRATR